MPLYQEPDLRRRLGLTVVHHRPSPVVVFAPLSLLSPYYTMRTFTLATMAAIASNHWNSNVTVVAVIHIIIHISLVACVFATLLQRQPNQLRVSFAS